MIIIQKADLIYVISAGGQIAVQYEESGLHP